MILTKLALPNHDVLKALNAGGYATNAALATALGRDKSNLGKTLIALHAEGLTDAPSLPALLTGQGMRVLAALERAADETIAASSGAPFLMLRHDQIVEDPNNARKHFDEDGIADLADTMFSHGLKQKPSVRPEVVDGKHELTMGARRWRAWGLLITDGRWPADHVEPCWIDQATDAAARAEGSLIENLQREDLNHAEIGEAFELLATTHGRSNKEIAERVGCTPEYVQQHRRLMKLDEDELEAVRTGETSMHDALRSVAAEKPKPPSPRQMLILAEVAHKLKASPRKGYQSGTEVAGEIARTDADLKVLEKANVLSFTEEDWQDHRAYIGHAWAGRALMQEIASNLEGEDADAWLDEVRRCGAREANVANAKADGRYVVAWLNGPFELSDKAKAAIAKAKEASAQQRAQQRAEKERRAARLKVYEDLDEALRHEILCPVDDRLAEALNAAEILLPLSLKNGKIVDANGTDIFTCSWRFGDGGEGINLLLATAVNAAGGYAPIKLSPKLLELAGVSPAAQEAN